MKCKSCNSTNLRRFEALYEQGTRESTSSGPHYNVHHVSHSSLALKCAPPTRSNDDNLKSIAGITLIYVFGLVTASVAFFLIHEVVGLVFAILAACISIALSGYIASKVERSIKNDTDAKIAVTRKHYDIALDDWKHSWYCMRCGHSDIYRN